MFGLCDSAVSTLSSAPAGTEMICTLMPGMVPVEWASCGARRFLSCPRDTLARGWTRICPATHFPYLSGAGNETDVRSPDAQTTKARNRSVFIAPKQQLPNTVTPLIAPEEDAVSSDCSDSRSAVNRSEPRNYRQACVFAEVWM